MINTTMHISQEYRLVDDGSLDYTVTTYRGMNGTRAADQPNLVIANGWVSGTPLYRRLASHLIQAAKGNLAVTMYEEPLVGSSAYGAAYKAERLARSVRTVAWERPVTVMGHSRGWLTAAEVGDQLVKEQFVSGLAGLTPMGHGEMKDFDLKRAAVSLGTEVLRSPQTLSCIGSAATTGRLVTRGITHLGAGPVQGYGEIRDIMCADTCDTTAALSGMVPTTMITGEHDTVVPPDCLQRRLESAGYQGSHVTVNTTHVGALIDYAHAPEVYGALQEVL